MDFTQQYQHPNWQKKRLEVLEAANYTCAKCKAQEKQLHVHHLYYEKGRNVWEYDGQQELMVVCFDCHEEIHARKELADRLLAYFEWQGMHLDFYMGFVKMLDTLSYAGNSKHHPLRNENELAGAMAASIMRGAGPTGLVFHGLNTGHLLRLTDSEEASK